MDRHTLNQLFDKVEDLLRFGSPSCNSQANGIMLGNFLDVAKFALEATEPLPKPKHTMADNFPAGGLAATEPCAFCKDHEQLQDEHDTLKADVQKWKDANATSRNLLGLSVDNYETLEAELAEAKKQNKRLREEIKAACKKAFTEGYEQGVDTDGCVENSDIVEDDWEAFWASLQAVLQPPE